MTFVTGSVRWWLRAEGLVVFAASIAIYTQRGASWWLFAALFLAPDLSFAGYLAGPRVGAIVYNTLHSYVLPLALAVAGELAGEATASSIAIIWAAHIGFDRMLGYGLKYRSAFRHTHLGRLGP